MRGNSLLGNVFAFSEKIFKQLSNLNIPPFFIASKKSGKLFQTLKVKGNIILQHIDCVLNTSILHMSGDISLKVTGQIIIFCFLSYPADTRNFINILLDVTLACWQSLFAQFTGGNG
jgi:hypothetical protein